MVTTSSVFLHLCEASTYFWPPWNYTENIFLPWSWTLFVFSHLSFDNTFSINLHISSVELNRHSVVNSAQRAHIMGCNEHFSPQQQLQWLFVVCVLQVVFWLRRRFSIQRLSSVPSSSVCWIWSSSYLNELKIIGGQVELGRGEEEREWRGTLSVWTIPRAAWIRGVICDVRGGDGRMWSEALEVEHHREQRS